MKALWKGTISFGLVNIPIYLYTATESHSLGFTLLHAKCHTPLKYHRWCPHCEKEVMWDDTAKGLKTKKGFVVLTEEQLRALRPEKTETISVVEFVAAEQVAPIYLSQHYYAAPAKKSDTSYALFAKTLAQSGKVAIGTFVLRDKEYVCMLQPYENYLLLTTLHYSYEIRALEGLGMHASAKVTAAELKLAQTLIKQLTVKKFDMSKFKDTFAQTIKKLLENPPKKAVAKKLVRAHKKPTLTEALRASIGHKPATRPVVRAKSRR